MSNTRPTEGSNTPVKPFSYKEIVLPFLTAGLTGSTIACTLYPIEYIQTRMQIGVAKSNLGFSAFFLANWRPIFTGLFHANKASLVKNGVLSQRDSVHDQVHGLHDNEKPITAMKRYISTVATAGIIGFFDTVFTHYFANHRIRNAMGETVKFKSKAEMRQFAFAGINPRLFRNFFNAFFCIGANTIIQPKVNDLFPGNQYPMINFIFSNLSAGMMGSFIMNPLDVIYKRKIQQMDMSTMKTPSAWKVAKELIRDGARPYFTGSLSVGTLFKGAFHGTKPLFVGSIYGGVMNAIVFGILNGVDFEKCARVILAMDWTEGQKVSKKKLPQPSSVKIEEVTDESKNDSITPRKQ
jgi:hypothetical protein